MQLTELIDFLSNPAAYPHAVDAVEVRQTHLSVVFLAGPFAYKLKKPVNLGFVDFSTLDKRLYFCREEVRLNQRLAPTVYRGVVPITARGMDQPADGGAVLDWAVKMERLPDDATLESRLKRCALEPAVVEDLARKVAGFHATAAGGEHIAAFGRFDVVAGNARENFSQAAPQTGTTLSQAVLDRLRNLTEAELERLRPLIEARAGRGVPRDTHGDLHLDHVYLFPEKPPPQDLAIIDCIEFNERFRFADPVADMAFLVMDFAFHGRRDLGQLLSDTYFRVAGDDEGRLLLPFYVSYRAAVRGKVEGFELVEKEIPEAERAQALTRARAHWLLALGELETPAQRPCVLLVGGLPGSGKSTLARGLAEQAGFVVLRSDVVRQELAAGAGVQDLYTPEWSDRTYAECLRRMERLLFEGRRVLVDANFREERRRQMFLECAARWAVPALFLRCWASPETVRQRLEQRRDDASEADWTIYRRLVAEWEEIGSGTRPVLEQLCCAGPREQILAAALTVLQERGWR